LAFTLEVEFESLRFEGGEVVVRVESGDYLTLVDAVVHCERQDGDQSAHVFPAYITKESSGERVARALRAFARTKSFERRERKKMGQTRKQRKEEINKSGDFLRVDQVEEARPSLESEGRFAHYREDAPHHLQSDGASDFLGSRFDKRSILHIIVRDQGA